MCNFALRKAVALNRPCGLSRVQQRECEWRGIERECEQRCFECERECRLAPGQLLIGVHHRGRVPIEVPRAPGLGNSAYRMRKAGTSSVRVRFGRWQHSKNPDPVKGRLKEPV